MTNHTTAIVGRIPGKTGKKPKTEDEIRICEADSCETKLSRYNTRKACYQHRPPSFPRVRGRPR